MVFLEGIPEQLKRFTPPKAALGFLGELFMLSGDPRDDGEPNADDDHNSLLSG